MPTAKSFFYGCAGIFLLALSYHFGATSAGAQAPSNPVVATEGGYVFTLNGDIYNRTGATAYAFIGNLFTGSPTPATQDTWGQLKARYR
jgi:hypothetical protein